RELTGEPFGVNVFLPVGAADTAAVPEYVRRMAREAARYGVSLGEPVGGDDGYPEKVALLLREPLPVVSFSFGLPDRDTAAALRDGAPEVRVTVTHPAYAEPASDLAVNAIVVRGVDAGAHRGGADGPGVAAVLARRRVRRRPGYRVPALS